MSVLVAALTLLAATIGLWIGAHWFVGGASTLAGAAGISPLVVGLTVVAFGTSAPEISVSTVAALDGTGDVAVGNVVGSNVFNLGIVLGVVAVLAPFRVAEAIVRRDAVAMAGATAVATVVLADRFVSRPEGLLLLALLGVYLVGLAVVARRQRVDGDVADAGPDPMASTGAPDATGDDGGAGRLVVAGRLFVGLALVVVAGRLLVDAATALGLAAGISEWVVGVTIVAAGTSLPELVTSVVAIRRDEVGIAAGNVIGSNVFNLLGVLGIAVTIQPTVVDPAVPASLVWLGVLTALAAVVLATGRRLTRAEGGVLLAIGVGYWVASALG